MVACGETASAPKHLLGDGDHKSMLLIFKCAVVTEVLENLEARFVAWRLLQHIRDAKNGDAPGSDNRNALSAAHSNRCMATVLALEIVD